MAQKNSSANTSINSRKLPAIYGKVHFSMNDIILDYGCGKYIRHIKEYVQLRHGVWYGYDPYNQFESDNIKSLDAVKNGVDYVLLSNVLNVIDCDITIQSIITRIMNYKPRKALIITVYEGNKSGIGQTSKQNCYQRNECIKVYQQLVNSMGYHTAIKNKCIYVTP